MKRNFLKIVLGSLALTLGFTSCKKDCMDCFSYMDDGYSYTICENYFSSRQEYDAYRAYLMADGYAIIDGTFCED